MEGDVSLLLLRTVTRMYFLALVNIRVQIYPLVPARTVDQCLVTSVPIHHRIPSRETNSRLIINDPLRTSTLLKRSFEREIIPLRRSPIERLVCRKSVHISPRSCYSLTEVPSSKCIWLIPKYTCTLIPVSTIYLPRRVDG